MRLYRFIDTDKKIDVVVVTDGSCEQKRVFITESPRGVVPAGSVNPSAVVKSSEGNKTITITLSQAAGTTV